MRLPLTALALIAVVAPARAQSGGGFTVAENGRRFSSLQEAVSSLNHGDGTIRIAPGRYKDCAVQEGGNVRFVAEQPGTVTFDGGICEDKAVLVLRGRSSDVEGLIFTHTYVGDGNGAGIRMETGDLKVADTMFVDGQCGILSAEDKGASITVDHSTFSGLGKDPTGNGAHSLYIGDYGALTVTNSRFERGTGGHYVKSRAPRITVADNSFDDTGGRNTNYMIDLSWGATGRITGNTFVQGGNKENYSTMIAIAAEGAENPSAGLTVEGNTVRLAPAFKESTTFVREWARDPVTVRNNTLPARVTPFATQSPVASAALHGGKTIALKVLDKLRGWLS